MPVLAEVAPDMSSVGSGAALCHGGGVKPGGV